MKKLMLLLLLVACTAKPPVTPVTHPSPPITTPPTSPTAPPTTEPVQGCPTVALAWEAGHTERKAWSAFACAAVDANFAAYEKAQDAARICPKYNSLSKAQKETVWAQFFVGVAKFESSWSLTNRFLESGLGKDEVTGQNVYSEGLLQLSYGDKLWAPFCAFNWTADKRLSSSDPKKTIFDPKINLDCGIHIMANQIGNKGKAILSSGVYWSTLKDGGKYSQVTPIIGYVTQLGFCK